ncbi:hypothetical protein [Stenotrophomonas acidaminiphila]|uniref:hypothetical protein n=1 Tax=Stenotrophomonas acidaminiphila TaxID=128780 RepID=UPI0028A7BEAC|nr:hypothetical protein [Stenotrophomonas acidaminiphila]
MGLLIAALTVWDYVLAYAGGALFLYAGLVLLPKGIRQFLLFLWKTMPNGRIKSFLFRWRGRPDHSMIDPRDPWVQAQWIKKPQQRTNRINAPAEFIPGERVDQPRSGTRQQGPESRR